MTHLCYTKSFENQGTGS